MELRNKAQAVTRMKIALLKELGEGPETMLTVSAEYIANLAATAWVEGVQYAGQIIVNELKHSDLKVAED